MKIKLLAVITILFVISGCEKNDQSVDIDNILMNQKIVFIMSVSSYDEPYSTGYFIDEKTLRKCVKYLYHVNTDSAIRTEGEAIMDAPIKQLYGIRLVDDQEEFVWLGSEPGISERLDDSSSDLVFKEFGDKWYLIK